MSGRVVIRGKLAGETAQRLFDFISDLAPGETLSGVPTTTATVWTGNDSEPQNLVSGAAAISGTQVSQNFAGGVAGTLYALCVKADTSAGRVLEKQAYFSVMGDQAP